MDRFRQLGQIIDRQEGMGSPSAPSSPTATNRHSRSSSSASMALLRKPHNMQAKAAAQRLAQVMAHQSGDDDEEEDEESATVEYSSAGLGLSAGRANRPRPSVPVRRPVEQQPSSARKVPSVVVRPSLSIRTSEKPSARPVISVTSSSQPVSSTEQQPASAHSLPFIGRSPNSGPSVDHNVPGRFSTATDTQPEPPLSAQFIAGGRPGIKTVPIVPSAVSISLKQHTPRSPAVAPVGRDKRLSFDMGSMNLREPIEPRGSSVDDPRDSTVLQDEVDMLQEENDSLLDKLRHAEERCEEAEARARQLEKQVATLGEGVSMEARLLSRKEAALQQREAALRAANQKYRGNTGELGAFQMKAETATQEQLQENEVELRLLRTAVQRLVLTQEEMEEVVLKKCWLARYWGLCVQYGFHPDIAGEKHDFWSSFAPLPLEVVLAAGQKAKEYNQPENVDGEEREKVLQDISQLSGDGSAESMLIVEKGLRELASLRVEDAVLLEMTRKRRLALQKSALSDEVRSPVERNKFGDAAALSEEEVEDVQFKQAWLAYFWRRAKNHGLEEDIAEDRLQCFIDQSNHHPTSHDVVDVERGMMELRKLGLETSLWLESRRWIDNDSH